MKGKEGRKRGREKNREGEFLMAMFRHNLFTLLSKSNFRFIFTGGDDLTCYRNNSRINSSQI